MKTQPVLTTDRLVLRPFAPSDSKEVQRLAGDREIAAVTISIPHPYEDGMAEAWIATHADQLAKGTGIYYAVTLAGTGELAGACGLVIQPEHRHGELGYWIARPLWGRGYCTEATTAVVACGFDTLGLHRIYAHHMSKNPASGRVMRKLGMKHEGSLRHHVLKWGAYEDVECYGLLATDRSSAA